MLLCLHGRMRLLVLGPVEASAGPGAPAVAGRRGRDLVAALATRRGQSVPAEVLLDRVWGDAATGPDVAVVHTQVARLRRVLGPDALLTEPGGYRLAVASLDADDFESGCALARRAALSGAVDEAVDRLRAALALWRGDLAYAGVSDRLVEAERARLAEARTRAAEDLVRLLLGRPDAAAPAQAHAVALSLVGAHPRRETPGALLAHAAYRLGRPAEALGALAELRSRLRRELGVDPGPAVADLQRRLLAQDPTLLPRPDAADPSAAPPPARSTGGSGARPPLPATETIGRAAELAAVLDALREGSRLVTVTGAGGVGKSRLLAEVGRCLPGGGRLVGYLDLAGAGRVEAAQVAELALVALRRSGPGAGPIEALVAALGDATGVLLVDEAEWAVEAVADVLTRVLAGCPGLAVVVTSRLALGLPGERRIVLSPLACAPAGASAADVLRAPAVRLLARRLVDAGAPDPTATPELATLLGRIARRVDGLPLALEIVAGHGATHSLDELVELLEAPLDVGAAVRPASARHRTLRDTLGWSVDRLDPAARRVLARLAVFAGPIDPQAAIAVAGAGDPGVDALVRTLSREGLLTVERSGPRLAFRMLRTVRDLALELLDAQGERAECEALLGSWLAARWRGQPRSDALIADVVRHYDDYLAALRWAIAARPELAADLLVTLSRFWLFGSLRAIGVRWADRVLAAALGAHDRARVRLHRSMLDKADHDASLADVRAAVPVLHRHGDLPELVSAHMSLALHATHVGDGAPALEHARRAVEIARQVGLERVCDALGVLAVVLADTGDAPGTAATVEEALRALRSARSTAAHVAVTSNLAHALVNVGQAERALGLLQAVLPIAHEVGGAATVDFLVETAGWANLAVGRPRPALGHFADVLRAMGAEAARSQYAVSAAIGVACALAALDDPAAAAALTLARERLRDSGFAPPPIMGEQLAAASLRLADRPAADPPGPDVHRWLLGVALSAAREPGS